MKKNRLMLKRKKKRGSLILIALFCIVLPIMAIYIGLRITELLVSPVLNSEEYFAIIDEKDDEANFDNEDMDNSNPQEVNLEELNKEDQNVNYITGEIRALPIYTIQIASLGDNRNIENLISELNANELSHIIYKEDNSYKVYTVGGTKRIYVETELEGIRSFYPDAYINEVFPLAKPVTYPKDDNSEALEAIINDLNEIIKVMDKQGEAWYNYLIKEGELDVYIELLIKQQELLSQLNKRVETGVEFPVSFPTKTIVEKMIAYQESNINRSIELVEENRGKDMYRLHSLYLDSLFRIMEIIK